jgi:hypothetical protein
MNYDSVAFVQITLAGAARWSARRALYSQHKKHGRLAALRKALRFNGPTFVLSKSHQPDPSLEVAVGRTTVNVVCDGSAEYIYPLSTVGRIKIIA